MPDEAAADYMPPKRPSKPVAEPGVGEGQQLPHPSAQPGSAKSYGSVSQADRGLPAAQMSRPRRDQVMLKVFEEVYSPHSGAAVLTNLLLDPSAADDISTWCQNIIIVVVRDLTNDVGVLLFLNSWAGHVRLSVNTVREECFLVLVKAAPLIVPAPQEYNEGRLMRQQVLSPADIAAISSALGSTMDSSSSVVAAGGGMDAAAHRGSGSQQVTPLGEVLYKEHSAYDLMVQLQLGIR